MAFLAAIPAAAAALGTAAGGAVATGAGALASGLGTAAGAVGSGLSAAGGAIGGAAQTVGQGALTAAQNVGTAVAEGAQTVGSNIAQGAETLVEGVKAPFEGVSNLAGGGEGGLSTAADPMLSNLGGGSFGGYGNVVSEAPAMAAQAPAFGSAPAQVAQVPTGGGGLGGFAEAQGLGTQNMAPAAQSMQQPGAMADLMSSPMAQDMGMGRGVTMAQGGQVGQAGGQAVPVGAETANAMAAPGSGGFNVDWQGLAKKGMNKMQQGNQNRQQQGQGAMAAPVPIPGAAPMGALSMPDMAAMTGAQMSEEEMARLRKLMGGF